MPGMQREYKDRLFKFLFGSPERKELTLDLYNALNGTCYDDPQAIRLTTIENVVYMGMHNDVSFLIDNQMSVWEQQSTCNPNLPLRMLLTEYDEDREMELLKKSFFEEGFIEGFEEKLARLLRDGLISAERADRAKAQLADRAAEAWRARQARVAHEQTEERSLR